MSGHQVVEKLVFFNPDDRKSWQEGGLWPHSTHGGFAEAAAAAHYLLRGYQVLYDFCTTNRDISGRTQLVQSTRYMHAVVGDEVSDFLCTELAAHNPRGHGEPDLFVFREDRPRDPKYHFDDQRLWFFVEVKGPGDSVRDNQRAWWSEFADRFGSERIELVRVVPQGQNPTPQTIEY